MKQNKLLLLVLVLFIVTGTIIKIQKTRNKIVFVGDKQGEPFSNNLPKYNLSTNSCDNMIRPLPTSTSYPDFDPNGYSWQTSAPRSVTAKTFRGDIVTLGFRNKFSNKYFSFSARVEKPNGVANITENALNNNDWTDFNYPTDFNAGDTNQTGAYTVIYQVNGIIVACDGFEVF
jgi:hypothetical protein